MLGKVIGYAALLIALALILYIMFFGEGLGVSLAVVRGTSMLPTLREGDVVLLVKAGPDEIEVGDVVVFRAGPKLIIHRVVEIRIVGGEHYYVTKGDNNPVEDVSYFDHGIGVSYSRIVGRAASLSGHVLKIPYLGYLSIWAHSSSS